MLATFMCYQLLHISEKTLAVPWSQKGPSGRLNYESTIDWGLNHTSSNAQFRVSDTISVIADDSVTAQRRFDGCACWQRMRRRSQLSSCRAQCAGTLSFLWDTPHLSSRLGNSVVSYSHSHSMRYSVTPLPTGLCGAKIMLPRPVFNPPFKAVTRSPITDRLKDVSYHVFWIACCSRVNLTQPAWRCFGVTVPHLSTTLQCETAAEDAEYLISLALLTSSASNSHMCGVPVLCIAVLVRSAPYWVTFAINIRSHDVHDQLFR